MAHVDNLRRHFPVTRHLAYFNTGTYGPLPDVAVKAMQDVLARQLDDGRLGHQHTPELDRVRQEVRQQLAALLRTRPERLALTDNTTQALNIVLWGLPLVAGDEIIYTDIEHPGSLIPIYLQKQRRGVVLKRVDGTLPGEQLVAAIRAACSARTRLVVLSHVSYQTGHRLPVERVAEVAKEAGAYCLVDGAQGAGADEIALAETAIDFYALPGHKWLCGPDGTGALYVRQEAATVLDLTYAGAASLHEPSAHNLDGFYLAASTARRFEHARTNAAAWVGLLESLRFLRIQAGWEYVFTRIRGLSGHLMEQLLDLDHIRVITPRDARVGLVTLEVDGIPALRVVEAARARNIDLRAVPERNAVRVSCGFYNTEDEIQRLVQFLRQPQDW